MDSDYQSYRSKYLNLFKSTEKKKSYYSADGLDNVQSMVTKLFFNVMTLFEPVYVSKSNQNGFFGQS